jgi:hypothetical protein
LLLACGTVRHDSEKLKVLVNERLHFDNLSIGIAVPQCVVVGVFGSVDDFGDVARE